MAAIVGAAGLAPTFAAVSAGSRIALANKECLVSAGALFMRAAGGAGSPILPVDSEHNAIFQILDGRQSSTVERIVVTASGGPFRTWTREQMARATPAEALRHPNWSMGPKITIDSATLMNKGLELIEAHYLFDQPGEKLGVLIHPQSIVHGLVSFADGYVMAALSPPDMRTPIAHCLAWPEPSPGAGRRLDLASIANLEFSEPDLDRFPALRVARSALDQGGWATNILSAANEIAVTAFLAGRIGFLEIARIVEETLERAEGALTARSPETIDDAIALDSEGRRLAMELIGGAKPRTDGRKTKQMGLASWFGGLGSSAAGYILPFLFVLTIVVFFHELGHFLVARWCGVRSRSSRSASARSCSASTTARARAGGCR